MREIDTAIGQTRAFTISISRQRAEAMAATMNWPGQAFHPESVLPPLWHWLGGGPVAPSADLGSDGHERLGLFLPDVPPSVRMWASGDVLFSHPLSVDCPIDGTTRIEAVDRKQGSTGDLYFVTLQHDYTQRGTLCARERQILVYRPEAPIQRGAGEAARDGVPLASYQFDDITIFRYSALTFNSHRIHLDRRYCAQHEGDDRLVVHAPLLATILARAAQQHMQVPLRRFTFRAHRPVREDERVVISADSSRAGPLDLWITGPDGTMRMSATASGAEA